MRERMKKLDVLAFAFMALLLATGALAQGGVSVGPNPDDIIAQPVCPLALDPTPSGVLDRPADSFNAGDYYWMHSSTHLQGKRAIRKYAPGLFYQATTTSFFNDFRSALIVNNPSPTNILQFQIFYYDTSGTLLTPTPPVITLGPEGTHTEQATPLLGAVPVGLGSASIISVNGEPFVGATIHHAYQAGTYIDPDFLTPGMASMQQLQVKQQNKTQLFWGPLPAANTSSLDFLNGIAPFFWVHNPNNVPNTVTIAINSVGGFVLGPFTVTIPANASHFDLNLWNFLLGIYLGPGFPFSDDFYITVSSQDGLPIIGEGTLTDFFTDGSPWNLNAGPLRMGSMMIPNSKACYLVNPELTVEPSGPPVDTIMGVWYPAAAGDPNNNLTAEYRDRNGVLLATDTITLPPNGTWRLGPGLASSPNYPTGPLFAGWARIRATRPGIVGWTMREIGDDPNLQHFHKVYGEVLQGANGQEPGAGFGVVVGGQNRTRKVSPILRTWAGFYWPSYTTFVNGSVANIGNYEFRFYDLPGAQTGIGAFQGLPWGATSFTYEDPLMSVFFPITGSGRVDHSSGVIQGIDAIGDPLVEWNIGFPFPPI